jgi:hypothetical protein
MIKTIFLISIILLASWANICKAENKEYPSHLELGVLASLYVQPSVGYWWGRYGIRLSGINHVKNEHEYHLNVGYVLSNSKNIQHSINLIASRVVGSDSGADYNFNATGIAYGINYRGFFFELGLAIPWNDKLGNVEDDPLVPAGYLGYLYRFKS